MGIVYRFITRAVLYNFFMVVKTIWLFIKNGFLKYRESAFLTLLLIVAMVMVLIFVGHNPNSGTFCPSFFLPIILFIAVCVINLFAVIIQHSDDCIMYEPKFIKWIGRVIKTFFTDISRPPDEQEELDRKEKRKKRELREKKKQEKEEKKRFAKEVKRSEENKFDRFEVMEVIE